MKKLAKYTLAVIFCFIFACTTDLFAFVAPTPMQCAAELASFAETVKNGQRLHGSGIFSLVWETEQPTQEAAATTIGSTEEGVDPGMVDLLSGRVTINLISYSLILILGVYLSLKGKWAVTCTSFLVCFGLMLFYQSALLKFIWSASTLTAGCPSYNTIDIFQIAWVYIDLISSFVATIVTHSLMLCIKTIARKFKTKKTRFPI